MTPVAASICLTLSGQRLASSAVLPSGDITALMLCASNQTGGDSL
jgi:hypothetical protein